MSDPTPPPPFDDFSKRLQKARRDRGLDPEQAQDGMAPMGAGLGQAWRIAIEIVTAVVVCTAIGWLLDVWWDTTPWVMLAMLFLGFAAGINNAVRTMNRYEAAARERDGEGGQNPGPGA